MTEQPVAASILRRVDLLVLSDVHLGTHDCQADALLRYLERIQPGEIVLNGDIIDLRECRRGVWRGSHTRVLERLLHLSRSEVPVHYLLGNHDQLLSSFLPLAVAGIQVAERLERTLGGRRTLFLHGHGIEWAVPLAPTLRTLGARVYRCARAADRLGRLLGVEVGASAMLKSTPRVAAHVRRFSEACLDEAVRAGCEAVITGHIHVPDLQLRTHQGRTMAYANSGDWVESMTALEFLAGEGWRLVYVDGEGAVRRASAPAPSPLTEAVA